MTTEVKDRLEEATKALKDARAKLEAVEAEGREPNAEEREYAERALNDFVSAEKEAQDARLTELKARLGEASDRADDEPERPQVKGAGAPETKAVATEETPEYKAAFGEYLRVGQSRTPALVSAKVLDLHAELKAQGEGTVGAGGALVPKDFIARLVEPIAAFAPMLGLVTTIDVSSNSVDIPQVSAHGSAAWTAEAGAFNESDETFATLNVVVYKATRLVKVSEELVADSRFDLDAYLAKEFGRSIGALVNTALTTGSGSSQPFGVVTRIAAGQVVQAATGNVTDFPADTLFDVKHKVPVQYRSQLSTWMMTDSSLKVLAKKKDSQNRYLLQQLTDATPLKLLGHGVVINPDVAEMGANAKSILFGDFGYHWALRRPEIAIQRLSELYSANGQVGYRIFVRWGADLTMTDKPLAIGQNSAT